jgi:hypothetical protein
MKAARMAVCPAFFIEAHPSNHSKLIGRQVKKKIPVFDLIRPCPAGRVANCESDTRLFGFALVLAVTAVDA